jgi:cobalamin synthase
MPRRDPLFGLPLASGFSSGSTGSFTGSAVGGVNRGLHLDGVADTADGLAANLHTSSEQSASNSHRLQVMSDSHTGAYGVLALGLVLLLKFAALSSLQVWPLLLLVPAWGRWGQLLAIALYPYLREQGSARFLKDSTSLPGSLWPGTLLLGVTTAGLGGSGSWPGASATLDAGRCSGSLGRGPLDLPPTGRTHGGYLRGHGGVV